MKNLILYFCLLSFLDSKISAQSLILKGNVRCVVQSPNTTKGAENVVVFPNFNPQKATRTASRPSGYFEINTGVPFSTLEDKVVTMYAISKCKDCEKMTRDVFITEDKDRQNKTDNNAYCTIKDWLLNTNCKQAEMKPHSTDSILKLAVKQSPQDLEKVSGATALVGSPTLLNFLTSLTSVVGSPAAGQYRVLNIDTGKILYGKFLFASPISNSANTGFNFAPSRDISEALFWNPSSIALSRRNSNISLLTNFKNNVKLSAYTRIAKKISIGVGGIYTQQDEFRNTIFFQGDSSIITPLDSMSMNLKEFAGFFGAAYTINSNLSLGFTLKSKWQKFNIPNELFIEKQNNQTRTIFTDENVSKQNFDIDISATYIINNALKIGMNLMNLAGSQFFGDAFIPNEDNKPLNNQRSLGLGVLYKLQRMNFGVDVLIADGGLYDAAFGINYVPFNNALLSAGIAVKQLSYSFAFRIKHFRIAYINDHDFLVNEKNKGKSAIFNGSIYGGLIFDLN